MIDWYKNNNKPIDEAEKEFEEVIIEKYAKCTEQNTFNNDQKSSYLNRANYFLLFSLVSIIVCMALFVISAIVEPNLLVNSIK
ncbi:hypothetical protein GF373_03460 [bacterium]|nr:hypothetical protein [bacterium]